MNSLAAPITFAVSACLEWRSLEKPDRIVHRSIDPIWGIRRYPTVPIYEEGHIRYAVAISN